MMKLSQVLNVFGVMLTGAALSVASAQEMPSRSYAGEKTGNMRLSNTPLPQAKTSAMPLKLRALSVPAYEVKLAPTKAQLEEAAASAEGGKSAAKKTGQSVAEKIGVSKGSAQAASVGPQRVGSVFDAGMKRSRLAWQTAADRSSVTQLIVSSAGAKGIRTQIRLPEGMTNGELRVASNRDESAEILPLSVVQDGVIWTPYTEGETQIIEIFARQNVAGALLQVGDVMHFEQSLFAGASQGQAKVAGSCNVDVACTSNNAALDSALNVSKQAVAKINFRSGSGAFICTGTLINSQAFPVPYFLTANHCISTAAEAASVSTQWFRYATACGTGAGVGGGQAFAGEVQVAGGAQLVFTNHMADSTLLQLNMMPPQGTTYSGWNAALLANGASIVSVSHPTGDIMKYSLGSLSVSGSTTGQLRLFGYPQDMYGITFTRGIIEGGSSGSGLFTLAADGSLQLRGVLSGTTLRAGAGLSCTNLNENATYGRFEIFYPQIEPYLSARSYPVDDLPNQPSDSATAIPLTGAPVAGTLGRAGDLDVFRIDVASAGTLIAGSRGGNDLIGALLDAQGAPVSPVADSSSDDAERGNNEFGITVPVTPGRYYLSVGHFDPAATTPNGYQVFAKFTTATENYTGMWWNDQESGWGINVNHQDNILFATLFTYDATSRATWLVMSNGNRQADGGYVGDLFRVTGPPFNANPFTPIGAGNVTRVGSMRIAFIPAAAAQQVATLTYDINGVSVSKTIKRQVFATLPNCKFDGFDRSGTANFTDMWWNPNESGWGLNIAHQSDIIFATLFNYDQNGRDLWLVMSNGALQTGSTNSLVYQGSLFRTTGPAFNASPFTPIGAGNITTVGNMKLEFTTGNAGKLTYDVNGVAVTKNIQRQVFAEARTSCAKP
jgi:lysyl endopeptidase